MNIETSHVTAALATIASFFSDDVTTFDGKTRNELGYPQEKILNGICWAVVGQVQYTEGNAIQKAKIELEKAVRDYQGNEISINQLQYKASRLESLNYQLAHLKAFEAAALEAYHRATGSQYVHRVSGSKNTTIETTLSTVEALLGKKISVGTDAHTNAEVADTAQTARKAGKR